MDPIRSELVGDKSCHSTCTNLRSGKMRLIIAARPWTTTRSPFRAFTVPPVFGGLFWIFCCSRCDFDREEITIFPNTPDTSVMVVFSLEIDCLVDSQFVELIEALSPLSDVRGRLLLVIALLEIEAFCWLEIDASGFRLNLLIWLTD